MAYIGKFPTAVPLSTSDLADNIVTVDKLATTLDLSSNTVTLPSGVGGKVLQVVNGVSTTKQSSTSTTYADISGLSASITPSSTSNKVLILLNINTLSNNAGSGTNLKLLRDSTVVTKTTTAGQNATEEAFAAGGGLSGSGVDATRQKHGATLSFLDSPSSTSALTYKVQFRTSNASNAAAVNGWVLNDDQSSVSTITLMEIAA